MNYFTKEFWMMFLGLTLIIALGLLGMYALNLAGSASIFPAEQAALTVEGI